MSAETTNVEKQAKQHRPALWGMAAVAGLTAVLLIAFIFSVVSTPEDDVQQMISTDTVGN